MFKKTVQWIQESAWVCPAIIMALCAGLLVVASEGKISVLPTIQAEQLLPGYYRGLDGELIDSQYPAYMVGVKVREHLPYKWDDQLRADKDLEKWLSARIGTETQSAHDSGVSGYSDRQLYWESRIPQIRMVYMSEVTDRYKLVPVDTAESSGMNLPPLPPT